jgi:hypothetical protein
MADYNPTGRPRLQGGGYPKGSPHDHEPNINPQVRPTRNTIDTATPFERDVKKTFASLEKLLLSKHKDYGPKNISLAPGGPLNGLRVRMWDKLARINNLVDTKALPEHESLEDSFKDMANYAIIGLLVLQGKWDRE